MMPRNLKRLTNAANNIAARRDWQRLCDWCNANGRADLIERFALRQHVPSWRQTDKAIAAIRHELTGSSEPWGDDVLAGLMEIKGGTAA